MSMRPRTSTIRTIAIVAALLFFMGPAWAQNANEPLVEFQNADVFPFSFSYPKRWGQPFGSKEVALGAVRLVAAEPSHGAGEVTPGAVAVTAMGYVAPLAYAKDRSRCALALFEETVRQRLGGAGCTLTELKRVELGGAKGRLVQYRCPAGGVVRDGVALVAAVGNGLLIAEIAWPKSRESTYFARAVQTLETFRVEKTSPWKREVIPNPEFAVMQFDRPSDWAMTKVRCDDASRAVTLVKGQNVIVIRSLVLPKESKLDDAACRVLAKSFLVDEMRLVSEQDIADAATLTLLGSQGGIQLSRRLGEGSQDILVFARGGSLHIVFCDLPQGLRDRNYGQAIDLIRSLKGPKQVKVLISGTFDKNGHVARPERYASANLDIFGPDLRRRRGPGPELRLLPKGKALMIGGTAGTQRARYSMKPNILDVTFERPSSTTWRFDFDAPIQELRPRGAAPRFFRIPDLP